jgi:hypothetical protein
VAFALRDRQQEETPADLKTETPRKLAPEWLPPGLEVTYSYNDVELQDPFPSRATIWGPSSTGDDFEGPSLLTTLFAPGIDDSNGPWRPSGEIEVKGRPAGYRDDDKQLPGMHTVEFEIEPDRWAMVSSRNLDRDTLVAVAESSSVDGNAVALSADALPDGWRRLHDDDATLFRGRGTPGPGASFIGWMTADYTKGLGVAVGPGDERRVQAMRAALDDVETVEIRGHRAIAGRMRRVDADVGTEKLTPIDVMMWEERPGEVVRITGEGIGLAELQRVAESLREITADEYAAFGDASRTAGYESLPTVTAGAVPGGTRWRLQARIVEESAGEVTAGEVEVQPPDGGPPFSVSPPDASATEEPASPGSAAGATFYLEVAMKDEAGFNIPLPLDQVGPGSGSVAGNSVHIGNPVTQEATPMAYGLVPSGAVRVELQRADGWVGEAALYPIADDRLGVSAYIGEVPEGTTEVTVQPFRADGEPMSSVNVFFEQ